MEIVGTKKELKKHVGTVEISNPLSLIQRKAFSILVHNAYHDLKQADGKIREIPMKALCELLGYDSKNFEYLDDHLKKLQTTIIEWRNNPDEFHRVTFFSYTGIEKGFFRYRFAPELEEKIYNPEIYARINILTVSQFDSRYALALYENLARYRPNQKKGFSSGSPKWTLEEFREIMGVSEISSYKVFRDLSKRVLEPAIKEINAVSDLLVKVEKLKKGRSIAALKFHIEDNPQQNLGFIPEPATVEGEAENPLAVKMNDLYGVPVLTAGEWLLQYGEARFEQVLIMTEEAVEGGKVKNPIGYMKKAFDEGWTKGKTATEARDYLKAQKRKKKKESEAKKKAELKAKEVAKEEAENVIADQMKNYLSSLTAEKKEALYTEFYDEHHESWFASKFPIARGSNPAESDNNQIQSWFEDYVKERL